MLITNKRTERTAKSRKNQNIWRKLQILWNIRSEYHQENGDESKRKDSGKKAEGTGDQTKNRDHPNHCTTKIGTDI